MTLILPGTAQVHKGVAFSWEHWAEMEKIASKVLISEKYSATTKELAASVLSQANKER